MANVIKHKRGSGSDPGASDLILGELAIRTDTGKLFTKMDSGAIAEIAGGGSDIAINTLSSSSGTGGGSATFNGSAYRFTLSAPPNVSAAQLLVSINGVIQKPVAGTGQPSEGFSVDGTDIILGDAPATGSDFFILTFKSLGVSEPADNSVTSAKIVDGAIVNADINASAAIAGSKINPVSLADVGIGVSSPNVRLHQHIGTSGTNSHRFTNTTTGTGSTDGFILGLSGDEHVLLWNYENTPFRLATNSTERVRVTESGLVGIGTTSPARKVHLHESTSGNNFISFTNSTTGSTSGDGILVGMDSDESLLITNKENNHIAFATNNTERMRLLAGGGLTFNGDTAAANALDDYEEGSFTPIIKFNQATNNQSYNYQMGRYTKIGNRVLFHLYVAFSNKGTASGYARVYGLPYTSANVGVGYAHCSVWVNNSNFGNAVPTGYVPPNTDYFHLERQRTDGGGIYAVDNTNFNNNTDMMVSGHYIV